MTKSARFREAVLLSDEELALRELRKDPLFRCMDSPTVADYIARSLDIGRRAAAGYVGMSPEAMAAGFDLRVLWSDFPLVVAGVRLCAEYDSGARSITLCPRSAAEVQRLLDGLAADGIAPLDWPESAPPAAAGVSRGAADPADGDTIASAPKLPTARELLLAHELFHHIEHTRIGRADWRLPPIVLRRFGPIGIGSRRVRRCREIAAHAFAKSVTRLPFLPNAFDCAMDTAEECGL